MKQRILSIFLIAVLLFGAVPVFAENEPEGTHVRILFTSDMHDYYLPDKGGAARLKTLIDRYSDENTLVLDAGDFSMGTLLGAGYATDAYEMRLMGAMGIQATTFGNHEWDFGPEGVCAMLSAANASGSVLPELVASSLDLSGELSEQQEMIRERFENGQIKDAVIFDDIGGKRIAVFGVMGYDSVECAPTSGQNWADYKTAAKKMVEKLQSQADVIVCLSHSGTNGDGESGEDIDLAKEVPGIDVILSGHTHTTYPQPVLIGDTILGSCGEYNHYLGLIDLLVGEGGSVTLEDYKLIPCDTSVSEDPVIAMLVDRFQQEISDGYLKDTGYTFDEPICHSNFDMISLDEMYATHQEYTTGNMIADSYLYEAKLHGVTDIDVALVGLGTIRGSVKEGDLTAADAFEICSLGVGSDGSAGHPLLCAYVTGKELKLLTELDASLGPVVSSI
ncbi:MAG: bifunctional metallophosphatase/5'-nucleotidase [Firmicutes bacterium]|nr:bifunctional metallophosphatase/5'-nucleotidase [Bacillota bacterium]